ncbi:MULTISPECIES: AbrB/MazE/SpoVT family DNA-binding domain-containing protein [unclassified Halanaerobium]|uniref:AbrB/MazE/SpoVT family DNA-binding domain-containing protein n=1 Tax=unclassified Halanaerobium TaxID=2641197 RepID=UPI000DF38B49|nr:MULTISPECIES: AbrB/MazE/SpoVT family DNA-binding domain-containing protein [unclassified Halanaerobium]RCW44109.1 AbrB family looped-hinge helix DNA binding protein [Halanaerobium sp. MA284_MarDTE_T2]RCW86967.1 AbrB family looped-hinge helix DNA binding protein [Halanaerobium sp. DL-01]
MSKKLTVKVDSRGRITIPKEARKTAQIENGDTLFMNLKPGKIEFIRAVEDPVVVLREYSEQEYENGRTKNLRDYAEKSGIKLDE